MAWVRLDDTMWTNRKARKAGESLAAYVLLLSWSGWALSDGVIPWDDVEFICGCVGDVDRHVAKLVEVGLVERVTEEGQDRVIIPGFLEFNFSREQVEAKREKDKKRKTSGNTASAKSPSGIHAESTRNPVHPVPVPVPEPKEGQDTLVNPPSGSTPPAEPFEAEFASWWKGYPRKVHRAKAFKAYKARRREGIDATDLDRALDNYAAEVDGEPVEYTMHGSTFLAKGGPWSERLDGPIHQSSGTRRTPPPTKAERTADRLDGWLDSWAPDEPDQGPYPYPISQELSA